MELQKLGLSFGGQPDQGKFIRPAKIQDALQIHAIYAPFVKSSYTTYEYTIPSVSEMADRIEKTLEKYPWIVYEQDGRILGYAYGCQHRGRIGYQFCVETAIYIAPNGRRAGIGKVLYNTLFEILKIQGFYCAVAWINIPNEASVGFHKACGFKEAGKYKVAVKFGNWTDTLIAHKYLKEMIDGEQPPSPTPFLELLKFHNGAN